MATHRLSINWRNGSKKTQFLASLMTISVGKTSFTIGVGVCQGTLMSTKSTLITVVRMWKQFHGCPASGGGIERVFFAAGKQHGALKKKNWRQDPGKNIEGSNQYQITDL
jgi:hypothetical protein